jgi:hypothetical protein
MMTVESSIMAECSIRGRPGGRRIQGVITAVERELRMFLPEAMGSRESAIAV